MNTQVKKFFVTLLVTGAMILGLSLVSGCAKKEGGTTGTQIKEQAAETGEELPEEEKVLSVGEQGKTDKMEIMVEKVTTTKDLTSPEATALLQRGVPGESPEKQSKPSAGNVYLMVTFKFKNIDSKPLVITPTSVKLENGDGKEYSEVSTSGRGGVFNMEPVEPGAEGSVTAVYEVPEGETGLVLTLALFDDKPVKFKVR